ncbi:MAG TPA: hypothetical protein VKG44_04190 [Candidatus Baltobacteraceae bacterium]|nr:hypothetical protein [Candidatus Baltobacteraceae bacterium]
MSFLAVVAVGFALGASLALLHKPGAARPPALASQVLPAATPQPSDDPDSAFARQATALVRQYLAALARGDDVSAYAALGAAPGARGVSLSEKPYVDKTTRLGRVSATGTSDSATVDVELQTAGGTYFGQYTVERAPSGEVVIRSHKLEKP